ncbi:hypothetical protein Sango_1579300 [Sesamum angolense]|uniref:Tf2-1-like SH3-like domain-containing protein n=1 Tax=Sesamum angolense TaxID=2727404 RepID=A0AAE2BTR8_9LAMI|nr:hypothetical protein Sango_1579300 [Sesamum angolense]
MYADKKRLEREFAIGDEVFLKLQPYRQTSITLKKQLKLSAKYFGPYRVIEKVRKVVYKLELLLGSKIHPVFHVSFLKKKATWEDYREIAAKSPGFDPWGQAQKKGGGMSCFKAKTQL